MCGSHAKASRDDFRDRAGHSSPGRGALRRASVIADHRCLWRGVSLRSPRLFVAFTHSGVRAVGTSRRSRGTSPPGCCPNDRVVPGLPGCIEGAPVDLVAEVLADLHGDPMRLIDRGAAPIAILADL